MLHFGDCLSLFLDGFELVVLLVDLVESEFLIGELNVFSFFFNQSKDFVEIGRAQRYVQFQEYIFDVVQPVADIPSPIIQSNNHTLFLKLAWNQPY